MDEILGRKWLVGLYTDDTAMTLDVARWLVEGACQDGRRLLELFCQSYDPGRRYGSGTAMILRVFPERPEHWRALATLMFPDGSFGNGSAMRAGPIGCFFHRDFDGLVRAAAISSRTTHSHRLALQGAVLQAGAVALACNGVAPSGFCQELGRLLGRLPQDASRFQEVLAAVEEGLSQSTPVEEMAARLGTGIEAMAAVPRKWLARVREDNFTPARVMRLAEQLYQRSLE